MVGQNAALRDEDSRNLLTLMFAPSRSKETDARSLGRVVLSELASILPLAAPFLPSLQRTSMFAKVKIWRQDD